MNRLDVQSLTKVLAKNLDKKISNSLVESWSQSCWSLSKPRQKHISNGKASFVMMLPPPNITGNLHLGHALTVTIQDAIIRQRRMAGDHVIWTPGFDHAGLATQAIVEDRLWNEQKLTRQEIGYDKFIDYSNKWKEEKLVEMKSQLDRLGLLLDHDREYFTTDRKSSFAVSSAFKRLFNQGKIYRDNKEVHWSEKLQSTLSDNEVTVVDSVKQYNRTNEIVQTKQIPQWFIVMDEFARKSSDVVQEGRIEMIPNNYKNTWKSWLVDNGVKDWCISRQNWWGHPIPAYKISSKPDTKENWIVADSLEDAKTILGSDDVIQDPDVLDTWFSSSLLPLTVAGWPNEQVFNESLSEGLFPLDIMETGFDILTYWVTKMVMMSIALEDKIPFKLILLHGMICDSKGKKMSKSKGNVINPIDLIEGASQEEMISRNTEAGHVPHENGKNAMSLENKSMFPKGIPQCGVDGLRAYLLSQDFLEEIVHIQVMQIGKVRRLQNKIWNLFRFALNLVDQQKQDSSSDLDYDIHALLANDQKLDGVDQILVGKLAGCVSACHEAFYQTYNLYHPFNKLERFYTIDLSKDYIDENRKIFRSQEQSSKDQRHVKTQLLVGSLMVSNKLFHPFMPHLTEFLYQKLKSSISSQPEEAFVPIIESEYPKLADWTKYVQYCK